MATAYVDYLFYTGEYGGSAIASDGFKPKALKASALIDMLTSNRVAAIITAGTDTDLIQTIKLAVCSVMDEQQKIDNVGGVVVSESVGSHSVSYGAQKSERERLTAAAKVFLSETGLLFRGFYADEYSTNSLSEVGDL